MQKVNDILVSDVRQMTNTEGLVLQGCGGNPQEWVNGMNELLKKEGILMEGDTFKEVSRFEHDGCTNMLFHMNGVKLHMGKLAMWRLQTHQQFGGTWLSDYLTNQLGVTLERNQESKKPDCPLIGSNGNIYNLMCIASQTLKEHGMTEEAKELNLRVRGSGCYQEALAVIMGYVNPVSTDKQLEQEEITDLTMGGM